MDVYSSSEGCSNSDDVLVAHAQTGDREAFGILYERHFDAVYRYVLFRIGNREDTEDVTTQVFLRAWQSIGRYVQRGLPFLAWLYRIAHNLIVDFRRKRRLDIVDIDDQYDLPDDAPVPERQITKDLQLQDVLNAMSELEASQQEVLTLRFMVGLSHKKVAAIVGRSEGAVRVIQYRALQILRNQLNAESENRL